MISGTLLCQAHPPLSDKELLENFLFVERATGQSQISLLQQQRSGFFARYNPVSMAFTGMMFVYQRFISPQLPSECLYEHSCSDFSKRLIAEYGLTKGVFTTADRLMRCNRMAATDVHPLLIGESTGRVMETTAVYKCHE